MTARRFGPLLEKMVSSSRNFRTAVVLATAMVVSLTVLSMMTAAKSGSGSHPPASGPDVVTVSRVIRNFQDGVDGAQSLLPSEASGDEVVLSIRDGFVLERGVVAEARTGVVFAVSGGCCLEDATVYSVRSYY